MPNYRFTELSTDSFEDLIQALGLKVISPHLQIFGAGPDGGREATYEGAVQLEGCEPWQGYVVVQAKFLKEPRDTTSDGKWAVNELRKELEAYAERRNGRRIPDYYIFCTNVAMSSVAETGAKDQAAKLFEEYRERVPIKGYDLWDRDKLHAMLDGEKDVRSAFAAWIMPGDVLQHIADTLFPTRTGTADALHNLVQKQFLDNQSVNLQRAGHSDDERTPLSRIFVDVVTSPGLERTPRRRDLGALEPGVVDDLERLGRDVLSPAGLRRSGRGAVNWRLLVGEQGRGKTTVAQMLTQLYRASILRDRPAEMLTPRTRALLDEFEADAGRDGLAFPTARRFPLHLSLGPYADEWATTKCSLLAYIAQSVRDRTDIALSADELRQWLREYPWLIVLDGLDEVAASANRADVLARISDFEVDLVSCQADVLLVLTSRPSTELSSAAVADFHPQYLEGFSERRALHFARRLADAKFAGSEDRADKVFKQLESVLRSAAMGQLMRTPLQITIMAVLVNQLGTAAEYSWKLFDDYFRIVYDRELARESERGTALGEILQRHRPHIVHLHTQAAWHLQRTAERRGGGRAQMSVADLRHLVVDTLERAGLAADARADVADAIMHAATERLVFLVGIESGGVGFEIRALQEYMAGEALLDGADELVVRRLRAAARAAHWRGVVLFAVGHCFARRQHLLESVVGICNLMNEKSEDAHDRIGAVILAGSHLALDILDDQGWLAFPVYGRQLARCALALLRLPPTSTSLRLAEAYWPDLHDVYREELARAAGSEDLTTSLSAVVVLDALRGRGVDVGVTTPASVAARDCAAVFLYLARLLRNPDLFERHATAVVTALPPREVLRSFDGLGDYWEAAARSSELITAVANVRQGHSERLFDRVHLALEGAHMPDVYYTVCRVGSERPSWLAPFLDFASDVPEWQAFRAAASFAKDPSSRALETALLAVADLSERADRRLGTTAPVPWPLRACLALGSTVEDLRRLAAAAREGRLGDRALWEEAERRWIERGITAADVLHIPADSLPFDTEIGREGVPLVGLAAFVHQISVPAVSSYVYTRTESGIEVSLEPARRDDSEAGSARRYVPPHVALARRLVELWRSAEGANRGELAHLALFLLGGTEYESEVSDRVLSLEDIRCLLSDCLRFERSPDCDALRVLDATQPLSEEWKDLLERLGRTKGPRFRVEPYDGLVEVATAVYVAEPHRHGIVRLLSVLRPGRLETVLPAELLDPERFDDDSLRVLAIEASLGLPDLSEARARALAGTAASLEGASDEEIAGILAHPSPDTAPQAWEAFLLTYLEALPPDRWRLRERAVLALHMCWGREPGRLPDEENALADRHA